MMTFSFIPISPYTPSSYALLIPMLVVFLSLPSSGASHRLLLAQPPLVAQSSSNFKLTMSPQPQQPPQQQPSPLSILEQLHSGCSLLNKGQRPLCPFPVLACPPSSLAPSKGTYPYAGWIVTAPASSSSSALIKVEQGGRQQCADRSIKCVDFANLCQQPLYRVFLHSHCAQTCGHCGRTTTTITPGATTAAATPTTATTVLYPWWGRKNGGERAPTKRRGIGEGRGTGSDRWWWGHKNTTATTLKGSMTVGVTPQGIPQVKSLPEAASKEVTTTPEGTIRTRTATMGERNGQEQTNATIAMSIATTTTRTTTLANSMKTMTTALTTKPKGEGGGETSPEATTTVAGGSGEEECEDVGESCATMERMCEDIAQRHIMGTFCRKTCNLC